MAHVACTDLFFTAILALTHVICYTIETLSYLVFDAANIIFCGYTVNLAVELADECYV